MEHHESASSVVMMLDLKMGICSLLVERKQMKLSLDRISTQEEFTELVKMIDRHNICQGISDEKFDNVSLISKTWRHIHYTLWYATCSFLFQ